MKKVIIESPYAGNIDDNIKYARECVSDSLMRGEAPIASHLLYTQDGILDDSNISERQKGIAAGLAWIDAADYHVFYIDKGLSDGMRFAMSESVMIGIDIVIRSLHGNKEAVEKVLKENFKTYKNIKLSW